MLTVERSKRRIEAITITADFSDRMAADDSIFDATVSIEVFSGDDPSPADMLYLPIIIDTQAISQRVKQGVPGDVYNVQFSAITAAGSILEQTTRIAIVPDASDAIPQYISLYLTTPLYPLEVSEDFMSYGMVTGGHFLPHIIIDPEYITASASIGGGTLYGGAQSYAIPSEYVQSFADITGGTMFGGAVTYEVPATDDMLSTATLTGGTLYGNAVAYDNPFESITSVGLITGGTFL